MERLAMASKGKRINIKLKSSKSPHMYYTTKNKQTNTTRLELKKYDPVVREHVLYKESR
jgi:large subunit ribosomal protein L33